MPMSGYNGSPYNGFAGGSPYSVTGRNQVIYPSAFTPFANRYAKAVNISGQSISVLRDEIKNGNPVIIWAPAKFRNANWRSYPWGTGMSNIHVITLIGHNISTNEYTVMDPIYGKFTVSGSTFETGWNHLKFAVSIR